jgi:glycosyltransferase involved in cell wall biosynthesis
VKQLWIVNYYSSPPEFASNPRHVEFSRFLSRAGYDVTILSTGYLRDKNIDLVPKGKFFIKKTYDNIKFIHIKVQHYQGNGISRMFSIFQFAWRILRYRNYFGKPDIVLHNIHAPFDALILLSTKILKASYVTEAWDLWPESFVRFGLISGNSPLVWLAYKIEKLLYEKAQKIIFTFEGGIDYLKNQKWTTDTGGLISPKKVNYLNNGVNLEKFELDKQQECDIDPELDTTDEFKVVYLGSIRYVNNIKHLIDAAQLLLSHQNIKFYIYGDGSDRSHLEEYCKENHITNVKFKAKWIPLTHVPYVISRSSLNILNYQKNFGVYGVSSGKLFQYLAAGKPICANLKMNYCLIEGNNLGVAKDLETPEEYADAILSIAQLSSSDYSDMCRRVLKVAQRFDYKHLSNKLIKILED